MELTITVTPYTNDKDNMLGFANVVIDNSFVLENIRIKEGRIKEYIDLPKYQMAKKDYNGNAMFSADGKPLHDYKDVFHPSNPKVNKEFVEAIINEYRRVINEGKENQKSGTYQLEGSFAISKVFASEYNREGINGQLPIRGIATVNFGDSFTLEKVRIKDGPYGLFADLPKYRTFKRDDAGIPVLDENGNNEFEYRDCFHAITKEAQVALSDSILDAFNRTPPKSASKAETNSVDNSYPPIPDESYDPLLYSPNSGQGRK